MTKAQLKKSLDTLTMELTDAYALVESQRMILAGILAQGFAFLSENGEKIGVRWIEWASEHCPGESPSALYRLKDAGIVAAIVGDTRGAKERTLEAFKPLLSGGSSEKVAESEQRVRDLFAESCKGIRNGKPPTEQAVREVIAAATAAADPDAPPVESKEQRRERVEKEQRDASYEAALGSLNQRIEGFASLGIDATAVLVVAATVVKMVEKHGTAAVYAAVQTENRRLKREQKETAKQPAKAAAQ